MSSPTPKRFLPRIGSPAYHVLLAAVANSEVPADMSTTSLVGGGLIAGDSLAALSVGIYGLLKTVS
jgi:hypothetical protein